MLSGTETPGTGTTTRSRARRAAANRKNITTGLIQANQVTGLANITDKGAQLFGDALLVACNTAIASRSWEKMEPLDFINVVVSGYTQMQHRA